MGKKPEKPKEPTPFEKFEQLAKRVAQVPKDHMGKKSESRPDESSRRTAG